jgi:putative endonuclease
MKNIEIGNNGESIAANYLQENGFIILERNWRHGHLELDIIASYGIKLHFVEVKTRRTQKFGHPEESITPKKMEHLKKAAEAYLLLNPQWEHIQFDVISILMRQSQSDIFMIEDVFF